MTVKINSSPDELYELALENDSLPYTGRQLISAKNDASFDEAVKILTDAGPVVSSTALYGSSEDFSTLSDETTAIVFENIGVILNNPSEISASSLSALGTDIDIEPETFTFVSEAMDSFPAIASNSDTWGLMATKANSSKWSGKDIRVAILDTGMDLRHPDFTGRSFVSKSFISGQKVQDLNGHGTHCTGTACGPLNPANVQRYGVAYNSKIFIGKVLSNSGTGTWGGALNGIDWAVGKNCEIISMSLGGTGSPRKAFEMAAKKALASDSVIIAASGNSSRRPGHIAPTGIPANSPSIFAVAAVDQRLKVAAFSSGGKIEISAPGVQVFSSFPRPQYHRTLSGTSMACPHVAGIAALWAQSDKTLRGQKLLDKLSKSAKKISGKKSDIGTGLVQAP